MKKSHPVYNQTKKKICSKIVSFSWNTNRKFYLESQPNFAKWFEIRRSSSANFSSKKLMETQYFLKELHLDFVFALLLLEFLLWILSVRFRLPDCRRNSPSLLKDLFLLLWNNMLNLNFVKLKFLKSSAICKASREKTAMCICLLLTFVVIRGVCMAGFLCNCVVVFRRFVFEVIRIIRLVLHCDQFLWKGLVDEALFISVRNKKIDWFDFFYC